MDLITPSLGLLIWACFGFITMVLFFVALVMLIASPIATKDKWPWVLLLIFVPIAGAIVYFTKRKKLNERAQIAMFRSQIGDNI